MSKSSFFSLFSVAALCLGLSVPAGAITITVSSSLPAGYTPNVTIGANGAFYGGGLTSNNSYGNWGTSDTSLTNYYLDPLPSTGYYGYAEAYSGVNLEFFPAGISSFSLLWGSPDSLNFIVFSSPTNPIFAGYTAAELAAYGLVVNSQTTQFVSFTGLGDVIGVGLASNQNSFEFGDIATVATPSPEPASIGLLVAGGLMAVGFGAARRRKS